MDQCARKSPAREDTTHEEAKLTRVRELVHSTNPAVILSTLRILISIAGKSQIRGKRRVHQEISSFMDNVSQYLLGYYAEILRRHALLAGRQDKGTTEFMLLTNDGVMEFFQEPNNVLTIQKAEFSYRE